jgi:hypothetical protein
MQYILQIKSSKNLTNCANSIAAGEPHEDIIEGMHAAAGVNA